MSPAPPRVLKVLLHSVDLMLHTLTVPSDEALQTMTLIQHALEHQNNYMLTSSCKKEKKHEPWQTTFLLFVPILNQSYVTDEAL